MPTHRQVNPASKTAAQPKLRIIARHIADLRKSGIADKTIEAERVFSSSSQFTKELFKRPYGPGMVFQFGEGFFRIKLDRPQTDGKQYCQVRGSINRLYVPWSLPNRDEVLADPTLPRLITEGRRRRSRAVRRGWSPCL
jgi:hypothetical protein